MTPRQLVLKLEEGFGRSYKLETALLIESEMARYTETQLDSLFQQLIQTNKSLPNIGNIYAGISELGFNRKAVEKVDLSDYPETDCKLCEGEGILEVVYSLSMSHDRRRRVKRFEEVYRYSGSNRFSFKRLENVDYVSYLYRCYCPAGQRQGLSRGWPIWRDSPF